MKKIVLISLAAISMLAVSCTKCVECTAKGGTMVLSKSCGTDAKKFKAEKEATGLYDCKYVK